METCRLKLGALRLDFLKLVVLVATLTACLRGQDLPTQTQSTAKESSMVALAPSTQEPRQGQWQGGPEELSGKLRSGISTYYRLPEAPLKANSAFEIELRFEGVTATDASVEVRSSDGLKFLSKQDHHIWRLSKDQASVVRIGLLAPLGDSYLHIMTGQMGRKAVRSFVINIADQNATTRAP
jgi:hypothetical protein